MSEAPLKVFGALIASSQEAAEGVEREERKTQKQALTLHHMGSTVRLGLWVKGEREGERERGDQAPTVASGEGGTPSLPESAPQQKSTVLPSQMLIKSTFDESKC